MARKAFLCKTFAAQYLSQKTRNDTLITHFLPGNIQDNVNTFETKLSSLSNSTPMKDQETSKQTQSAII